MLVGSDMVSRRSYEELQKEYETRVSKDAYDRLCVKLGEIQRRLDHEYTANENVDELRYKLKKMEQNIGMSS
jgi:hypothetical protein